SGAVMAIDWSQFQPAEPVTGGVDWSQFAPVPDEPRPLMASAMPDRTGEEALSDTATRIRQGLNSVVGGIVGAPVNLTNMLMTSPQQRAINRAMGAPTEDYEQPEFVRGIRESLGISNEIEGE